jgi:regulator of protease activity HflC (stomatin/prohibitin superfamily)
MFIVSIILAVIGVPVLIGGIFYKLRTKGKTKQVLNGRTGRYEEVSDPSGILPALAGLVVSILAAVALLLASLTAVPAQNVGVETSYGKPVGTLKSGLHLKAPWHKVTDMDGTIQQENNAWAAVDSNGDKSDARTKVRLASTNSEMFVNNQLRWRIKQDAAGTLFADWKTFDKIGPGLVQKQLSGALNDVLASYDPLTVGAVNDTNDVISQKVAAKLQERLGKDIEVVGFTITTIDFDNATQARIDDFQAEVARTRVAEQREKTAVADSNANNQLKESIKDPNVLVSKCLDTQKTMVEKGQSLTGAPGCFPGQNGPVQTLPVK